MSARPFALAFLLVPCLLLAQDLPAPKSGLTLRRQLAYPLVQGTSPSGASMSPDGKHIVFAWNAKGERMKNVWLMDYPDGQPREVIRSEKIDRLPRQDDKRTDLEKQEEALYDAGFSGFQWSPDSRECLSQYRGRTWIFDSDGKNLRALFDTQDEVSSPSYSLDNKAIYFTRRGNLMRYDRATGHLKQLTFISAPGTSVSSYEVSPDGKTIAVIWEDGSKIGRHQMMDFSKDRAEVVPISRGWIGEMGQNVQIGLVPADGGLIKFVPGIPRYTWITSTAWSPNSEYFAIGRISEDFKTYNITTINPRWANKVETYEEKAPKNYIPDFRELDWTRDSKSILFTTDIVDGKFTSRSLMKIGPFEKTPTKVFSESYDLGRFTRPRLSDDLVLVTQKNSPLQSEITILHPDGTTESRTPYPDACATANEFDKPGLPLVSDDGKAIATLASHPRLNTEMFAVWPKQKRITVSQQPDFAKVRLANVEHVSFPGPDGQTIYGMLLTPPDLDRTKKHPAVITNMYANSGRAQWVGVYDHYMAAELGFVVLKVNFRGSWGQGGEFNSGYAKSLGIIDADESVSAKKFLVDTGYVNADRCGVWGWSYGGFLTLMIMTTKPGVFDTGVAVASVTDWKSYNEWYTRRRLGLPTEDKDIYTKTSPVNQAKGLQGNLLTIHGMLDDNVLYQDIVRFRQALIREGKFFDSMDYPRANHSIGKDEERTHVYEVIVRYLYNKLSRP